MAARPSRVFVRAAAIGGSLTLALAMGASAAPNGGSTPRPGTRNPLRLAVLRLGVTEPAWTSPLNRESRPGVFGCAGCGATLFDSSAKYDSGSGWPSFTRTSRAGAVAYKREWDGRVECRCGACGGHLGHVFPDGPPVRPGDPPAPKGDLAPSNGRKPRFCVNGLALVFTPADSIGAEGGAGTPEGSGRG